MQYFNQPSNLFGTVTKRKLLGTLANNTGTTNGTEYRIDGAENIIFTLSVTAITGAAHTYDVKIQHRQKVSDSWVDTGLAFTQVSAAGSQSLKSDRPLLQRIRFVGVGGGTETTIAGTIHMAYTQGMRGRKILHGTNGAVS